MFKYLKHISLFFVCFVGVLLCLDIVFQKSKIISGIQTKLDLNDDFLLRKGYESYFFNEGFGIQKVDSSSLLIYNPNKNTVYNFYGDSYVEGQQVFQRHHFGQIFADNKDFTVRNFGQSSMNLEGMFARYFNVKDQFPANKHVFFISDDDFDTDDIKNFMNLPQFDTLDNVVKNTTDSRPQGIKQNIERAFYNSSLLVLLKSDLRQIRSGNIGHTIFDKFSPVESKLSVINYDLVKPKRVNNLLNLLNSEADIIIVYRGKRPLSKYYESFFFTNGIKVVDLEKAMSLAGTKDNFYYHAVTKTTGHWNREGHKFIGNYLSNEL